jgi:hypothetical protein
MYRKQEQLYVVVYKKTLKVGVFKEKSQVCDFLGVSYMTMYRNFHGGVWENDKFIVKYADEIQLKSFRGDKRGKNLGEYKRC